VRSVSQFPAGRQFLSLDLVRGLAALTVTWGHVRVGVWGEYAAFPASQQNFGTFALFSWARLGHEAVLVFFVLSGFLVGGRVIGRLRAGTFDVSDYILDRTTRILLPLIPACVLTALINEYVLGVSVGPLQIVGNMAGLNGVLVPTLPNNVPLWSLAFEIWFYVLAGAVGWLFVKGASAAPVVGLVLAVLVFGRLTPAYLMYWEMGALTTLLLAAPRQFAMFAAGLALMAAGVVQYQTGVAGNIADVAAQAPAPVQEGMICAGFCLCIPFLCAGRMDDLLRPIAAPVRFFSSMSFSLYLVHFPIVVALRALFSPSPVLDLRSAGFAVLSMACAIAAAGVFWMAFESQTGRARALLRARFGLLRPSQAL
jgi:peptidoglycan/LPS O-acetylase OafA/YrhL